MSLRANYTLDPDVAYLNHGSFGAMPKAVQANLRHWQTQLERNPVRFMWETLDREMARSLSAVGRFVGADPDNLAFVTNATQGVNAFARSLNLAPGDQILATDQEYGATRKAMIYYCRRMGAEYVERKVPVPAEDPDAWVDELWEGVTDRTRVVFFSHIAAPTALIFPLERICARARSEGLLTVCDGAHAPGHVDLDLQASQVDFYTGNCHKWLSSARGCGFIYVDPGHWDLVEPLIVGHGWDTERRSQSPLQDYFGWQGTRDPCGFLTLPTAIKYLEGIDWPAVRERLHGMAAPVRLQLADMFSLPPLSSDRHEWWKLMFSARLPPGSAARLGNLLWEKHRIIAVLNEGPEFDMLRVSVKEYNSEDDLRRLLDALESELLH